MEFNFTPATQSPLQLSGPTAWRRGKELVVDSRRPILPDRCPLTGSTDDLEQTEIQLKFLPVGRGWHRVALYLSTGVLGAAILESRFGELIELQGAVSSKHPNRRARLAQIGWLLLAIGIVLAGGMMLVAFKGDRADPERVVYLLIGALASGLLGCWAISSSARNLLRYVSTEGDLVVLSGAHPEFLRHLPDIATRPEGTGYSRQITGFTRPKQRSASYGALAHLITGFGAWIVLVEFVLFVVSRRLGLPEDVSQGLRDFAFWGGLIGVHLAVLGGLLLIWFSQSSAEWRLGMAAGAPLFLLVLIGVGQDLALIRGWNAVAEQQVAAARQEDPSKRKPSTGKLFLPRHSGVEGMPWTTKGPGMVNAEDVVTEKRYRFGKFRFAPTQMRTHRTPCGVWNEDEFLVCLDGHTVDRIQTFGMQIVSHVTVGDEIVGAVGFNGQQIAVATDEHLYVYTPPRSRAPAVPKSVPWGTVERILPLPKEDLLVRYRDASQKSQLCKIFWKSGSYATERGGSAAQAEVLKKTEQDFLARDKANRERWQRDLSSLKGETVVHEEGSDTPWPLRDVLADVLPKADNHYFPDPTGRQVMVVGATLTLISREGE